MAGTFYRDGASERSLERPQRFAVQISARRVLDRRKKTMGLVVGPGLYHAEGLGARINSDLFSFKIQSLIPRKHQVICKNQYSSVTQFSFSSRKLYIFINLHYSKISVNFF